MSERAAAAARASGAVIPVIDAAASSGFMSPTVAYREAMRVAHQPDVIFDIGLYKSEDTYFFLSKGVQGCPRRSRSRPHRPLQGPISRADCRRAIADSRGGNRARRSR